MATKATSKKTNSRKKTDKTAPPPPPKRKSGPMTEMNDKPAAYGTNILGGIIFLVLAICSVISYFNTEGSFVAYFSDLVRGLLGWGFYLAAPAFAISAYLLFTCGTKPVGSRVFATVMLPVLLIPHPYITNQLCLRLNGLHQLLQLRQQILRIFRRHHQGLGGEGHRSGDTGKLVDSLFDFSGAVCAMQIRNGISFFHHKIASF
jgi:hypothetical protein